MKVFNLFTDFCMRGDFWHNKFVTLVPTFLGKTSALTLLIISAGFLMSSTVLWVHQARRLRDSRKNDNLSRLSCYGERSESEASNVPKPDEESFVPHSESIKMIARETACYGHNGHDSMWEELGITQGQYYESVLSSSEKPLYGRSSFSEDASALEKIPEEYLSFGRIIANENALYSPLNEKLYTDVSYKIEDLNSITNEYKAPY